jgi:hypothetical protein
MLAAMNVNAHLSETKFDVYENDHPMFCDVMDCKPGELAQRNEFLSAWMYSLSRESSDRADMLLLEAVYLLEGLEAVHARVRTWRGRQPRAWLFWIRLLVLAEDWRAVATAAEEALPMVDHGSFRALIAERLVEAAKKIDRADLLLTGRRETFFSVPSDSHLLWLIEEANRQNLRGAELEKALEFVSSKQQEKATLLVKVLLMTGRVDGAFETARAVHALGWSYGESAGAVLFAGILSLLCLNRIEEAVTIRRVLKRYADTDYGRYPFSDDAEDAAEDGAGPGIPAFGEILRGLRIATVSPEESELYLLWAVSIGRKRIEEIVANKHRGAYDRAAEVLGSLAECYLLNGDEKKGREIIDEYRNQRFNRHSAFRRELDSIIASSGLLRNLLPGAADSATVGHR